MGLRKTHTNEGLREVVEREHGRDLDGLLLQLRTGDKEQRRWAARDLAGHHEAGWALGEQLMCERDSTVRQSLFTSLSAQPGDEAVNVLLPLLRSEDAELRNGAIEVLAGMPAAVGPRIKALLKDRDVDVRIFTVNLLGDLRHSQVRPWLLEAMHNDAAVNVVAAALEVLAEVGVPEDLPALTQARQRFPDDPFIGFAAEMAAQRIRGS